MNTTAARVTGVAIAAATALIAASPAMAAAGESDSSRKGLNAAVGPVLAPAPEAALRGAPDPKVKRAQQIMTKFGIPAGAADGLSGPQTVQGLCAFRRIAGLSIHRGSLDTGTYNKLVEFDSKYATLQQIPGTSYQGKSTYVHVQQRCQTMFYVVNKTWQKVLPVSTGVKGHLTPSGSYTLGNTLKGWWCSTLYPESCRKQTTGEFVNVSNYGNMYNPRQVVGAIYVHGSTSVPTSPASHGCIRVTVANSDWLYHNVDRLPIFISGSYWG